MCAFVVNVPLEIEASRELEARLKESERTGPSTPTISPPSRHSLSSVCFFPVLGEFRSHRASPTYLGFLGIAPPPPRGRSCGVPLYFHFRCLPPWRCFSLYLSNSTPGHTKSLRHPPLPPPSSFRRTCIQSAARTLRLHYTGSFPPRSSVSSK